MQQIMIQGYTLEQLAEALKPLLQPQQSEAPAETENVFLTRQEVCKVLSINLTTLHKLTKKGDLKAYGTPNGNRVLYRKSEVIEAVKPINH